MGKGPKTGRGYNTLILKVSKVTANDICKFEMVFRYLDLILK